MTSSLVRPSDVIFAVSTAVLLHVLLFAAAIFMIATGILGKKPPMPLPDPPAMVTVEISPEMFERPKAAPEAEEERRKRLARTTPEQESDEAPENADLIGERDTRAASELPPDPDAVALPSQDGVEPRRPDEANTFDSSFADGEAEAGPPVPPSESTPPPGDPLLKPNELDAPQPELPEKPVEESPPEGGEPREETMRTETEVPVPREEEAEEEAEEETLPKESESESEPLSENQPGGAPDATPEEEIPPPKNSGFQSEVKKTKLRGSIGRKGTTALDVENSPIGRYQAKLSRAVEREWQMNCVQYRDHITPGALTIRFLLDAQGDVSGVRFLKLMEGGEIQQGFTLKAIQQANIPAMPKEIVEELNGDPLELIYNFYF